MVGAPTRPGGYGNQAMANLVAAGFPSPRDLVELNPVIARRDGVIVADALMRRALVLG